MSAFKMSCSSTLEGLRNGRELCEKGKSGFGCEKERNERIGRNMLALLLLFQDGKKDATSATQVQLGLKFGIGGGPERAGTTIVLLLIQWINVSPFWCHQRAMVGG